MDASQYGLLPTYDNSTIERSKIRVRISAWVSVDWDFVIACENNN